MILFLYGEDNFRSLRKLNQIIYAYKQKYGKDINLRMLDCQKCEFEDFRDQFRTKSIFKQKKFFVLKNAFSNKDFTKKFIKRKKEFLGPEKNILFYQREKIKKRGPFFNFLKKHGQCQEFEPLKTRSLKQWTKKEFKNHNAKIQPQALDLLIEWVGNDLWRLSNEIIKLCCYKKSGAKITTQDVRLLINSKIDLNIFKTIDFIAQKNKKQALLLIHKHIKKGDPPLYLLSMICYQFRILLMIKEKVLKNKSPWQLKLPPFVIKKGLKLAYKFKFEKLKKVYRQLASIDQNIKIGKIKPELALDLLVAAI